MANETPEDILFDLGVIDEQERQRRAMERILAEQLARARLRPDTPHFPTTHQPAGEGR